MTTIGRDENAGLGPFDGKPNQSQTVNYPVGGDDRAMMMTGIYHHQKGTEMKKIKPLKSSDHFQVQDLFELLDGKGPLAKFPGMDIFCRNGCSRIVFLGCKC